MNHEFGKTLRRLRQERTLTQEKLADTLKVSPQAVSKWETGVGAPDIALLPALSIALGVRIDDLFALTDEETLERIGQMLQTERELADATYETTEIHLKDLVARKPDCADAWLKLARLHEHRIGTLTRSGTTYAKQAIRLQPECKSGHSVLTNLLHGFGGDWTQTQTLEMVRYYRALLKRTPDWEEGWRWLLDQLIGNGLLEEARSVVQTSPFRHNPLAKARLGDIAYAAGDGETALRYWQACIDDAPDQWRPYAWRADKLVAMGRYEDALKDYEAWHAKQPVPRYTDPCICRALIYEEQGRMTDAIRMREEQERVLREEHGVEAGEGLDGITREIARLRSLA